MSQRFGYGSYDQRPDQDDLPHTEWICEECHSSNSCLDAECQFCDGTQCDDSEYEE